MFIQIIPDEKENGNIGKLVSSMFLLLRNADIDQFCNAKKEEAKSKFTGEELETVLAEIDKVCEECKAKPIDGI